MREFGTLSLPRRLPLLTTVFSLPPLLLIVISAVERAFGNESVQNRLPRTPRLRGRTFESHVECETRSKTKRDPELPCETSGIVRYDSGYRLSDARVASYERRPGGILGSCGGTGRSLPWCHPVLKRDSVSASLLPFGAIFSGVHWFLPDAEILWKDALAGGIPNRASLYWRKKFDRSVLREQRCYGRLWRRRVAHSNSLLDLP